MGKKKIFNDPIYGIISFPHEILYDLIDHRYFQRLRRISQTGMAHYVFPGAIHTRFQHALGALHLMTRAIATLRQKGVVITKEEDEAVCIAILLHDIGHGPYSHALEREILDLHHEDISLLYMEALNEEFGGKLALAIQVFKGEYDKQFLHQLVSSQLDMDRMDYLSRDSYFTGVAEGVIGYDRLIKMLCVVEDNLAVEEKGIYSVEKFLMARRLMYWQVYLHKTALGAEQVLTALFSRVKKLIQKSVKVSISPSLEKLIIGQKNIKSNLLNNNKLLDLFSEVDDIDVMDMVKRNANHSDYILSYMCQSLIKRQLFKVYLSSVKATATEVENIKTTTKQSLGKRADLVDDFVLTGFETNQYYNSKYDEILIHTKEGRVEVFSKLSDFRMDYDVEGKYYICYPPPKKVIN